MKIICVGRNYALHAAELNNEVPKEPVLFLKPDTAVLKDNKPFYYPEFSKDIHYEAEVVVKINRNGRHIEPQFARRYYEMVTLGIDFTARDVQAKQKAKGLPWEIAKAFDHSAVLGKFVSISSLGNDIGNLDFQLDLNGEIVQKANTNQMIFHLHQVLAYASQYFCLKQGDLIFTGTPQGVGPVKIGDRLSGKLAGKQQFDFSIK